MSIPRLSLTEAEIRSGFDLIRQYNAAETYPLHTHDFYEITYISSGKGIHCINGQSQLLTTGSLVLIRPFDIHSFKPVNYFDFTIYSLGLSPDTLATALSYLEISPAFLTSGELPPQLNLVGVEHTCLEKQLQQLLLTRKTRDNLPSAKTILVFVLTLLSESVGNHGADTAPLPDWLVALDLQMSKPENYLIGLPRLLELANYSQEYMNRMFRKYLQMTPTEYINSKRLISATELLISQKYSILEICHMTGFHNLSYFYSVFKKQYRCTPNQLLLHHAQK